MADSSAVDGALAVRRNRLAAGTMVRDMHRGFDGRLEGKAVVGWPLVLVVLSGVDGLCAARGREESRSWLGCWLDSCSWCGDAVAKG